ncbi:putative u1 small nuclear ribonucleoprotein [Lasiodiplodia theobromae]|uniref:U1 small nuclear ribonucleoprotein n=1 Tax=Lasiodiplodia theobromae TaxID=45133 RepID=A0A8H7IPH7_9PEZI|nr:putative u1 small nuclear ribonucleoprotein [Lasiodiplodia theobromae]
MTDKLPPNLLALFAPRPALRYLPPSDHAPEARKTMQIDGVGSYLQALKDYEDDYVPTESWLQRKDRLKREKAEKIEKTLTEGVANFKPADDPNVRGDPFRTLFVARLSYDTETKDLEREFGRFGPIERIRIVQDTTKPEDAPSKKKNRGYAFIVYEREKDMKGKSSPVTFPLTFQTMLQISRSGIGYQSNGWGGQAPPEGAPAVGSRREYRDRDRDGGYGRDDYSSRKRGYDGDSYEDSRSKRRY